jgi:hypothetical protein
LLVAQQAMEAEPTTAEAPAVEAALADAPVDRTFTHTFTPVSGAWADADDEEEEVGGARARHMEEMQEKYKSRCGVVQGARACFSPLPDLSRQVRPLWHSSEGAVRRALAG